MRLSSIRRASPAGVTPQVRIAQDQITVNDAPRPKRHHYLPQFYLEGSADATGFLSLYDRSKREYRRQRAVNTAVETGFYTVSDMDGHKLDDVEKLLAAIEGEAKPAITALTTPTARISDDQHIAIAHFAAAAFLRSPGRRRSYNEGFEGLTKRLMQFNAAIPGGIESQLEQLRAEGSEIPENVTAGTIREFVERDAYSIHVPQEHSIKAMVELLPRIADLLGIMDWVVLHAPANKAFITSDEPFVLMPPPRLANSIYGAGLATPGAMKFFPLTSRACLGLLDMSKGRRSAVVRLPADGEMVRAINVNISANCERFVLSHSEPLLRSIVRASAVDSTEPRRRMEVG